jgi:tRNA (guanosine-2'-O-)-methyltransferase
MTPLESGKDAVERLLAEARPVSDGFTAAGRRLDPDEVVRRLAPFLSEDRRRRIESVLDGRTYAVATVVEGLSNSGNVSAVMRTAEALGFQRFDLVTGSAPFKHSRRTTQGAQKWLDVHVWPDPDACVGALKAEGYRVVAAHLGAGAEPVDSIDFTVRTALVFGNELSGVSERMLQLADARCVVPMTGFAQSYNISVAAAIALYRAWQGRTARLGRCGDLAAGDRERLRAEFHVRALRNARAILERSIREEAADG